MTRGALHVLERKSELVRGGRRVAPLLRTEMGERGLSAKELATEITAWARLDPTNRQPLDYRTIQNAMDGSCALETYFTLAGYFGWNFVEAVQTPVIGADPVSAREAELARHQTQVEAIHARLQRDRASRTALAATDGLGRGRALQSVQMGRRQGTGDAEETSARLSRDPSRRP